MMEKLLLAALFFCLTGAAAQPRAELLPNGFTPLEIEIPATPNERLIELSRNWAMEFNRREQGHDITGVTANSMTISAFKRNAFYYANRGESFEHKIRYEMRLTFYSDRYTLQFVVTEIYADDNVRIEYTLPDYFTSGGKLKEGYEEIEPSLEATVNGIIRSHYNFITNFR